MCVCVRVKECLCVCDQASGVLCAPIWGLFPEERNQEEIHRRNHGFTRVGPRGCMARKFTEKPLQHTATHCNTLQHTALAQGSYAEKIHRTAIGNILQHIATHCNQLQHTATHYNTLPEHTANHCNTLKRIETHYNTLQRTTIHSLSTLQTTATYCNEMKHTAMHCNTRQRTATHCTTLQHAAAHEMQRSAINTPQHTATHCNTLQPQCVAGDSLEGPKGL